MRGLFLFACGVPRLPRLALGLRLRLQLFARLTTLRCFCHVSKDISSAHVARARQEWASEEQLRHTIWLLNLPRRARCLTAQQSGKWWARSFGSTICLMNPEDSSNRRRVRGLGVASSPTQRRRSLIAHSTFVCGGRLVPRTNRSKRILLVSLWRASNHEGPNVRPSDPATVPSLSGRRNGRPLPTSCRTAVVVSLRTSGFVRSLHRTLQRVVLHWELCRQRPVLSPDDPIAFGQAAHYRNGELRRREMNPLPPVGFHRHRRISIKLLSAT